MRAASAEIITLKTKGLDLFFLVICESALNETYVFAFFVNLNIYGGIYVDTVPMTNFMSDELSGIEVLVVLNYRHTLSLAFGVHIRITCKISFIQSQVQRD